MVVSVVIHQFLLQPLITGFVHVMFWWNKPKV